MAPSWGPVPPNPTEPLNGMSTPLLAEPAPLSPDAHGSRPSEDGIDIQSISGDSLSDDAPLLRTASTSGRYPNILPSVVAQRHRQRVPSVLELSILSGPELSLWERLEGSARRKCAPPPPPHARTCRPSCSARPC